MLTISIEFYDTNKPILDLIGDLIGDIIGSIYKLKI